MYLTQSRGRTAAVPAAAGFQPRHSFDTPCPRLVYGLF